MMINQTVLMETGMKCLVDTLGEVGAERFITQIIREPFDYTKWQRGLFDGMSIEEIGVAATRYCKENPR
jgi:hypothetical protein